MKVAVVFLALSIVCSALDVDFDYGDDIANVADVADFSNCE